MPVPTQHALEGGGLSLRCSNDSGARVLDRQRRAASGAREDSAIATCPPCSTSSWSDRTRGAFDALLRARIGRARRARRSAATRRHSGCTPRAARGGRRAACICSTTWSSARSSSAKGVLGISRGRSLLQRRQAVLRLRPRQRAVLPARRRRDEHSLARTAAARARLRGDRAASADACSSRCRPATACCWRTRATFDLSSIRLAVSAGEALPPALYERFKRRFGIDIIDGIGSTEALHMFISNRPGDDPARHRAGAWCRGYEARILDDGGRRSRPGEIGNLWISGDSTCACYWNQHEKTKAHDSKASGCGPATSTRRTRRLLLVRRPLRRHAEGRRAVGQPGRGRERARRASRGAGMRRRRPRGSRRARQAGGVTSCCKAGQQPARRISRRNCSSSSAQRLAEYKRPRWVEFLPELPKTADGQDSAIQAQRTVNQDPVNG